MKGHEEQYRFNANIQDHVASRQLDKLTPPEREKLIVEKAMKELQEGASSLVVRQKHVHFADHAENGWDAANKYLGYNFTNNEEDNRKLESSDRSAGVKKCRKAAANAQKPRKFPGYRADYGYLPRRYEEFGPQRSYQEVRVPGLWPANSSNKDDAVQEAEGTLLLVWPAWAYQSKLP